MAEGTFSRQGTNYYWKEERGAGGNGRHLHFYEVRELSKDEIEQIKKEKKEEKKKKKSNCAKLNCFNKEEGDEEERIIIDLGM